MIGCVLLQTADILTKVLAKPKHTKHTGEIGLMEA